MAPLDKMDPRRAKSAPGAIELNQHFGAETDLLNLQCNNSRFRNTKQMLGLRSKITNMLRLIK